MDTVGKLPEQYAWLLKVKDLPRLVLAAISIIGTKEIPGPKSNPVILNWAKVLGLAKEYTNDFIAWCGLTMAWLCHLSDKPQILNPLWALNWRFYGIAVINGDVWCGDIYVKERRNSKNELIGGHVGVIIAEDETHWHVFGGNTGDECMIARFPKTAPHWIRRIPYSVRPKGAQRFFVNGSGVLADKLV